MKTPTPVPEKNKNDAMFVKNLFSQIKFQF